MAGFVKKWAKRTAVAGLVGIAALAASYYAADRHLTKKYEHEEEREVAAQGIERLVQGPQQAGKSLSPAYFDYLTKEGYWERIKDIEINNYDILFVEEEEQQRIVHYRVSYTNKKNGERNTNFGLMTLAKEGSEWKIVKE